jgi:uncharacterized membrane protein YedE/YeeE
MKAKITGTFIPTLTGIFIVLGILILINVLFFGGTVFSTPDNGFFSIFVPIATLIALIIQLLITLPVWARFRSGKKIVGLSLFPFTVIIIIISGLAFGYVFWEPIAGHKELMGITLTGIGAFAVYWSVNILLLYKIDKNYQAGK